MSSIQSLEEPQGSVGEHKPLLSERDSLSDLEQHSMWYIRKCLWFSLAFFFAFTAWHPLQNLETSLAPSAAGPGSGVSGRLSLGLVYGSNVLAAGTIAPYVVKNFGAKACMIMQFSFFLAYIVANLYPRTYTVYPASLIVGVGSALLWVAEGQYITDLAVGHSRCLNGARESSMGLFNGIFFMGFELTQVVGNFISSAIDQNSKEATETLFGVYIGVLLMALVVTVCFVPKDPLARLSGHRLPLPTNPAAVDDTSTRYSCFGQIALQLYDCLRLIFTRKMILFAPILCANGLAGAFIFGDFTDDILGPAIGTNHIGYAMSAFGAGNAIASYLAGAMLDRLGMAVPLVLGSFLFAACLLAMYMQAVDSTALAYGMAVAVGISNGIMFTAVYSSLTVKFSDETATAYGTKAMIENASCAAYFFGSDYIALNYKLIYGVGLTMLGVAAFLIDMLWERSNKHKMGH